MTDALVTPPLFDRLAPAVRVKIATAIADSMRGGLSAALVALDDDSADGSKADLVARAVARAQLLHLDRRDTEALAALDDVALPAAHGLPEEIRIVLEQNRVAVVFGRGQPVESDVERHYGQVDRRKLLGLPFRNADALLEAAEASTDGKNYDSLPLYSRALFDAYRQYNWHGVRESAGYLSRELLQLNSSVEAIYFAMLSEDKAVVHAVADHVRAGNDAEVLRRVNLKLLEVANLRRHVAIACEFLIRLGDSVDDFLAPQWLDRLRPARARTGNTAPERWDSDPAWDATAHLIAGAAPNEADAVIDEVLRHPRWAANDIARYQFYEPFKAAVGVATIEGLRRLLEAVVPHVATASPGHDYRKALDLLLRIAERSPELKRTIAVKLYDGKTKLSQLLTMVAPSFGKRIRLGEPQLAVTAAVEHLRAQVERLSAGVAPKTGLGETMIHTKPTPQGTIAVKVGGCQEELHALVTRRKDLSAAHLSDLVNAVLETISDVENLNENRVMLFDVLRHFSDVVGEDTAQKIADVAAKFSDDHRDAAHPLFGQEEEHARLNPFRMNISWPQDVRGAALLVVAQISQHHTGIAPERSRTLLFKAMADANPAVRRNGYNAVALAGRMASECLAGVVGGTRDSDPSAANFALQIVGEEATNVVAAGFVPSVLGIIEVQYRNPDSRVRFATATVVRRLRAAMAGSAGSDVDRIGAIADRLKNDISRRVRGAITSNGEGAD